MEIRKATIKDFKELIKLKMLSKREELKYSITLKPLNKTKKYYLKYLKADLTDKERAIFIAIENKKIVGIIVGKFYKPIPISKYSKKGYISNLYILKPYRNKGIAKKLILKMIKWFKENKVPHISLEIHIDNTIAQNLYRKLKFKDYTIKLIKDF